MKKSILGLLLVSTIFSAGFLGFGKSKDTVAKVGRDKITKTQIEERIENYPEQFKATLKQKENKERLLDQIIDEKLLLQAAKKAGYSRDDEFKQQIEDTKKQLLLTMLIEDKINKNVSVTDDEVAQYFKANPNLFGRIERRRAKHILVKEKSLAERLRNQIRKGQSFETLAKKYSIDPTKNSGGDLGWFTKGQLVPEFEKVVFALKKGQLSGVVQTQFGYHIIKLTDTNVRPAQKLDDVKAQIKNRLTLEKRQKLTDTLLDELKQKVKVTKYTDNL